MNPEHQGHHFHEDVPYIEPDWFATDHHKQVPVLSSLGDGPRGAGVIATVVNNDPDNFVWKLTNDITGETVFQSPNLAPGVLNIEQLDADRFQINLTQAGSVANSWMLTMPKGEDGSMIFTLPTLLPKATNMNDVYDVDTADLVFDGVRLKMRLQPIVPRLWDTVIFFVTEGSEQQVSQYVAVGHIVKTDNGDPTQPGANSDTGKTVILVRNYLQMAGLPDAPWDGETYLRQDGEWVKLQIPESIGLPKQYTATVGNTGNFVIDAPELLPLDDTKLGTSIIVTVPPTSGATAALQIGTDATTAVNKGAMFPGITGPYQNADAYLGSMWFDQKGETVQLTLVRNSDPNNTSQRYLWLANEVEDLPDYNHTRVVNFDSYSVPQPDTMIMKGVQINPDSKTGIDTFYPGDLVAFDIGADQDKLDDDTILYYKLDAYNDSTKLINFPALLTDGSHYKVGRYLFLMTTIQDMVPFMPTGSTATPAPTGNYFDKSEDVQLANGKSIMFPTSGAPVKAVSNTSQGNTNLVLIGQQGVAEGASAELVGIYRDQARTLAPTIPVLQRDDTVSTPSYTAMMADWNYDRTHEYWYNSYYNAPTPMDAVQPDGSFSRPSCSPSALGGLTDCIINVIGAVELIDPSVVLGSNVIFRGNGQSSAYAKLQGTYSGLVFENMVFGGLELAPLSGDVKFINCSMSSSRPQVEQNNATTGDMNITFSGGHYPGQFDVIFTALTANFNLVIENCGFGQDASSANFNLVNTGGDTKVRISNNDYYNCSFTDSSTNPVTWLIDRCRFESTSLFSGQNANLTVRDCVNFGISEFGNELTVESDLQQLFTNYPSSSKNVNLNRGVISNRMNLGSSQDKCNVTIRDVWSIMLEDSIYSDLNVQAYSSNFWAGLINPGFATYGFTPSDYNLIPDETNLYWPSSGRSLQAWLKGIDREFRSRDIDTGTEKMLTLTRYLDPATGYLQAGAGLRFVGHIGLSSDNHLWFGPDATDAIDTIDLSPFVNLPLGGGSQTILYPFWTSGDSYAIGDHVNYNYRVYVALTANSNKQPDTSTTDWSVAPNDITAGTPVSGFSNRFLVGGYAWYSDRPATVTAADITAMNAAATPTTTKDTSVTGEAANIYHVLWGWSGPGDWNFFVYPGQNTMWFVDKNLKPKDAPGITWDLTVPKASIKLQPGALLTLDDTGLGTPTGALWYDQNSADKLANMYSKTDVDNLVAGKASPSDITSAVQPVQTAVTALQQTVGQQGTDLGTAKTDITQAKTDIAAIQTGYLKLANTAQSVLGAITFGQAIVVPSKTSAIANTATAYATEAQVYVLNTTLTNSIATKQATITATGATNVLLAPAAAGGQPGTKAIADFVLKGTRVSL